MIIALLPNLTKPDAKELAFGIRDFLVERKIEVVTEDSEAKILGIKPLSSVSSKKIDFIISMGGDGTILRLVHRHPELDAPIIGINLGSLGFLADIPAPHVYGALEQIISGKHYVHERQMLDGHLDRGESCFAVNEMVVHRSKNPCLVELAIFVDGLYLNTFSADGIIVSTASGSTAYSLSAGGPIVTPDLEACVITPICPHTISNRPIVLMPKKEIVIQYLNDYLPVEIIYDGIGNMNLSPQECFRITPSKRRFKLVSTNSDFYSTLRTKLAWTGTLKI